MRVGIDFGGTKIAGVMLDASGATLARYRVPTPACYDDAVSAVVEVVRALEAEASCAATRAGVGIPGTVSPASGRIKNANSTFLIGTRFDADLVAALGLPVRLQNDANCLAVSEAWDGAGKGYPVVFAVILGTGCGGGLVVNGQIHQGPNAVGGEWGHNPLPWPEAGEWPGMSCYCGRAGCLETWLSGPALAARYLDCSGERTDASQLAERAQRGDAVAMRCLTQHQRCLARGLSLVINTLDPDVIVVGGGVSALLDDYASLGLRPSLQEQCCEFVFGGECRTPVRLALHGPESGVRGAAWLFDAEA